MGTFKGVLTHQTVSLEDLKKIMTLSEKEINSWSNVGVKIVESADILFQVFARSIVDVIIRNNKKNITTKLILPVGPISQYPILASIINNEKINLQKVWFFFMDEYLDWESRWVNENHPMSFRGFIYRHLVNLINIESGIKRTQIIFPNPLDLEYNDRIIEELGGIDVCYGGLGYHGHIAFNEPYDTYFKRMTIQQFINSKTRIVELNPDTFVINSLSNLEGNCYDLPPQAVTIGMKSIMGAKRIEIYCASGHLRWQPASFRLAIMHPPTLDRPSTLLQLHSDSKNTVLFVADKITAKPIEIGLNLKHTIKKPNKK